MGLAVRIVLLDWAQNEEHELEDTLTTHTVIVAGRALIAVGMYRIIMKREKR